MRKILEKDYKVYSFDIFDTVLFRTVRDIGEIYIEQYHDYPYLFPEYIDGVEWANLRSQAEKIVRGRKKDKYGSTEIYLREVYEILPSFWENTDRLEKAEFETEKKLCYVNPEIYEQIVEIKEKKHGRVILTSDMYYSEKQLRELLGSSGFDLDYVDAIYVSCDQGCSKKYRKLYGTVLEKEGIRPSEMIHIGDNEYSDYSMALKCGIDAELYGTISNARINYPHFEMEKMRYKDTASELYSLRAYGLAHFGDQYEGDEGFWYRYGLSVLGPLCTGASEWVWQTVHKEKIHQIFPLMREAKFLCRLLEKTKEYHNDTKLRIRPLYISRKAVYLPSMNNPSSKDIQYVCTSNGIRIKDLFDIFRLENHFEQYKQYGEIEIASASKVVYGERNLKEEIISFLCSEKILQEIAAHAREEQEYITEYFRQMGLDKPYATWDMGWRGYTQNAMNGILKNNQMYVRSLNLLIVGRSGAIANVLEDCDIRGYVSNYGKNWDETIELYARIYELFYICDEGTTIGYQRSQDAIEPITREIRYHNENEIKLMERMQEGVLKFQELFYQLARKKPHIKRSLERPEALCRMVGCSMAAPVYEEAMEMSKLFYDQNFGADSQSQTISESLIKKLREEGCEKFFEYDHFRNIEWFSGIFSLEDPLYYFKECCRKKYNYTSFKRIHYTQRILREYENDQIVLVGGGVAAKEMIRFIKWSGKNINIEGIIDNSPDLQGTYVCGIPIYSMEAALNSKVYVITTFQYIEELTKNLREKKGDTIHIFSYRQKGKTGEEADEQKIR